MKRILTIFCLICLLCGCRQAQPPAQIAATTRPVYEFTSRLCEGTGLSVTRLITESVSCLHDYSLSVSQVKAAQAAELVLLSGAGLEAFMSDYLVGKTIKSADTGIPLLESCPHHGEDHVHTHEADPHFWLSPVHAMTMAGNLCAALEESFPAHRETFQKNLSALQADLQALLNYAAETLSSLSCREMITFHDGFAYFAQCFDLTILEAVEEESGSEASAKELSHLIGLVQEHQLPAIFTEANGSTASASIIARETGIASFSLDMAMANGYFDAMYHNINTVKEALG